jgi:murein L,D-transpeptidase YafK
VPGEVGSGLSRDKLRRAEQRREALLARLGLAEAPRPLSIVVRKAERRLRLEGGGRELLRCRVGLGGSPVGIKTRRGDGRTPEGAYSVCTRNPNSQFHLFLGLSYPNEADADRGLAARLISPAQHRVLVSAARAGSKPSWETALGGTIGIHGSGSDQDWTLGCIALDDADIETLWALCPIGTPVRIEP